MWKWIVIGWVVVLILGFGCWSAMRKATGNVGEPLVVIHAPAERVWASLATIDSLPTWRGDFIRPQTERHHPGPLETGDTLRPQLLANARPPVWVVVEAVSDHLLVTRQYAGSDVAVMERRDSLATHGDSTIVLSSLEAVASGVGSQTAMRLAVSMMRPGLRIDLDRLKRRIEKSADTLHKPADTTHKQ